MPDRPNPGTGAFPGPGSPVTKPKGPGPGTSSGPQVQGSPGSPCLISFPSASVPLVGSVGGGCLFSKTSARALIGGLLIGAGGLIFIGGIAVLAVAGFRKTGALDKVAGGVAFVPGVGPAAAAGLRTAARPEQRYARRKREGARADAALERRMGQPRENANLRTGRGAVRETPAATRRRAAERDAGPPF